ncbi:hypothetical protein [[Clostridium] dakarense]|uniref:hypothetical protein n=1 Tax=Faecalimicrobium dakarense TaxID=1301100 RepID=UPI0004B7317A|nr:hypothetical protein [[Clostridium] dakarense]
MKKKSIIIVVVLALFIIISIKINKLNTNQEESNDVNVQIHTYAYETKSTPEKYDTALFPEYVTESTSTGDFSIYLSNVECEDEREEFNLKDVYLEISSKDKTKKYELNKSNSYRVSFKKKDLPKGSYKMNLIATYKNGLVKTLEVNN